MQAIAKELAELELHSREHRVEILHTELAAAKDGLAKFRDNIDRTAKERYEALVEKAKRKEAVARRSVFSPSAATLSA